MFVLNIKCKNCIYCKPYRQDLEGFLEKDLRTRKNRSWERNDENIGVEFNVPQQGQRLFLLQHFLEFS